MPTTLQKSDIEKPLNRVMWWLVFLIATFAASLGFKTFGAFTLRPNLLNASVWALVMLFLFLSIAVLAYDSYVHEKFKGNVQKPVKLFEWMIRRGFLLSVRAEDKGNAQ
jgi:preprotein translocase subunit SecG